MRQFSGSMGQSLFDQNGDWRVRENCCEPAFVREGRLSVNDLGSSTSPVAQNRIHLLLDSSILPAKVSRGEVEQSSENSFRLLSNTSTVVKDECHWNVFHTSNQVYFQAPLWPHRRIWHPDGAMKHNGRRIHSAD